MCVCDIAPSIVRFNMNAKPRCYKAMARRATPWDTFITADNDVYLKIDPKLCAKDNYVMQPCKLWGFGLGDYQMINWLDMEDNIDKDYLCTF